MLNEITLMGRLTKDPELRHTNGGVGVCSFSIAVERNFKDTNGEKGVDFIDIVTWRNTAEFVSKYFTRGRMIVVHGSLQIRDYTDKNGVNVRKAEVIADSVYFGDSKRPEESNGGSAYNRESSYAGNASGAGGTAYGGSVYENGTYGGDCPTNLALDDSDDLPFRGGIDAENKDRVV